MDTFPMGLNWLFEITELGKTSQHPAKYGS